MPRKTTPSSEQPVEGEITVTGSVSVGKDGKDGKARRITLDPLRTGTLSIPVREVENTIPCGFQQQWVSATISETGEECDLACGAGTGSRWMTFRYKGQSICVNVADILNALIDFVDAKPEPSTPDPLP